QVYVFQDGVGAADYGYLCGSNLGAFASRKATRRKMTCVGIHVFPFENLMPKTLKSSLSMLPARHDLNFDPHNQLATSRSCAAWQDTSQDKLPPLTPRDHINRGDGRRTLPL